MRKVRPRIFLLVIIATLLVSFCAVFTYFYLSKPDEKSPDSSTPPATTSSNTETPKQADKAYLGEQTIVANEFSVVVPNGWQASISEASGFKAIMFAKPEQLSTLSYQPEKPATVLRDGIASWSGLTEHFFILAAHSAQKFNPSDHQEISSEPFTFDDTTVGVKYLVIKHASEATKWGGLLRDSEWQGRTYIYEKNGKQIEAHLALYPSSQRDIAFFESVARTININITE